MNALEKIFAILFQICDALGSIFWALSECLRIYREWRNPGNDPDEKGKG